MSGGDGVEAPAFALSARSHEGARGRLTRQECSLCGRDILEVVVPRPSVYAPPPPNPSPSSPRARGEEWNFLVDEGTTPPLRQPRVVA